MSNTLNPAEAPKGFYAVVKPSYSFSAENICKKCDARSLCQENRDNWCSKNRCMSDEIVLFKSGEIVKRQDGCSVIYKRNIQG